MLVSSRFRTGSGTTSKTTNRSPGDPHLFPSLPSPLTLNRLLPPDFVQSGKNKTPQKMRYLDSFPFPYYIVLRDIEA
ncbi:hypothetical protein DY000_02057227 [Brassica cretica]|uniref:Uncharacterized protein n=1 Tax=Brassica cretica TaxID=69181 RepID=A0ABQ7AB44_BRACR|nr:hypothetical protein DY000_02057227 [Brassica cretica]